MFGGKGFTQIRVKQMKRPLKVKAPEGCAKYLTPGKIYDVNTSSSQPNEQLGYLFTILSDDKSPTYCSSKICGHLNFQDWIIIETEI